MNLVLSLFPGIGLLDRAFEEEGFCVVRGPDLLWGGDIKRFHSPAGRFDGVIGGPPCQRFSSLAQASRKGLQPLAEDLIPDFARVVTEAKPRWYVMENVPLAPRPFPDSLGIFLNNRWVGGEQNRKRVFYSNLILPVRLEALEPVNVVPCVTANGTQWERGKGKHGGRSRSDRSVKALANYIRWQGLPDDFLEDSPLTVAGKVRVVGNGVPLPMGRAIAKAVKEALSEAPSSINQQEKKP